MSELTDAETFMVAGGPDGAFSKIIVGRNALNTALGEVVFGNGGPVDSHDVEEHERRWERLNTDETNDEHGFPLIFHENFEDGWLSVYKITDPVLVRARASQEGSV